MGDISTTITVDVSGAGELDALAAAADKAAAALDKLQESAGKGFDMGAAGAGADKLAASYEAAFAKIQAGMDKLNASMAEIGKAGGGADAGAASLAKIADAEKAATAQADAMAASVAKADDSLKGLGGSADASAAGLGKLSDAQKSASETAAGLRDTSAGVSDGLKAQADQTAALTALQADMADSQRALTALSAEHAVVIKAGAQSGAESNDLLRANKASLATESIEQDAQMRQSTLATKAANEDAAASAEATAGKYHMVALGGAAALAVGIDMAAKLQTSVTRLYTTAGESQKNLPLMSAGILALSGQTNTSQAQLGQGAYMVESAGFHGQSALNVLKAAAEGAQSEGAPLGDTANALTSLLNAYGMKGPGAPMSAMDQIIAMVSRGKMTMAGAVGALPDVLPTASAAKLSFADVGGALSTMTSMGVSPDRAAQNLSHVITSIMNPNAVQTKEQQQLGLNPVQIQNDLGKQGLTGTLTELSSTVMKQMGPAGDILFKTFNQSRSAAADAQTMISAMPPAIRGVAQAYADGKTTVAQWNQEMFKGSESSVQKNMLQQFATTENQAKGFNDLLKTGAPDVQTYAAAMDKLLGGQTGLNVAMELTGQHMPVMKANTDAIAAAARNAGDNVTGWSKVQGTLNFQLGSFAKSAEAVATEAGQVALPAVTGLLKGLSGVGGFLASNPDLAKALTVGGGALGAMAILPKLASVGTTALGSVGKVAETLNIPGLSKLAGIGQGAGAGGLEGAASGLSGAAGSLDGAAGSLEGAAASLKGEGATGGLPGVARGAAGAGGAAEGEAGAAAEGAGGAGIFAKIFGSGSAGAGLSAMAGPVAQGLVAGLIIKGVGDQLAPKGTAAGTYNQMLQQQAAKGGPASQLSPNIFGGFEGKLMAEIGLPVGKAISAIFGQQGPVISSGEQQRAAAAGGVASRFGATAPVPAPVAANVPASTFATPPAPTTDQLGIGGHPSPIKISVDTSALDAAKGKVQSDIAGLGGHPTPIRLPAPDTSAIDNAKSKVQSDIAGLGGHPSPVRLPAPDLSALIAAKGAAAADGAAVGAGFAAGIAGEAGAAAAAGASLAAAAEAAMKVSLKISSPSKVAEKIGQDFTAGFSQGIIGNEDSAKAASAEIGSASVASLLQGLAGGSSNIQNAIQAVMGAASNPDAVTTIQQTVQTLIGDVPAKDTALVTWLTAQQSKLSALANKQGQLTTEITDAQQIATSAIGAAGITSAYGYTPALAASNGPTASQSILTGMQQQAQDTKAFAAQLTQLKKEGLNATSLSQLAQAGATAGLPLAEGLAQGGKGAVQQLNATEKQIIAASQQIGNVGGPAMYTSGEQVGAGLAQGLKDQLKQDDKIMTAEANAVIAKVQKVLGTKAATTSSSASGSTAATTAATSAAGSTAAVTAAGAGLGKIGSAASSAAGGLSAAGSAGNAAAGGLNAVAGAAGAAAAGLGKISSALAPLLAASPPAPGKAQPLGGGGYAASTGGGGGGTTVHNHNTTVHVHGTVTTQTDLAQSLQGIYLEQADRNLQTGLQLRGRGA